MTDPAVLQARLTAAETALHELALGAKTVSISFDGKSMTYNQTNMATLRAYIAELRQQLGLGGGRQRPFAVRF